MYWSSETLMQSFVSPQYIYSLKDCNGSSLVWRLTDATHSQEQNHSRRVEWAKIVSDNAESKYFRWPHSWQKIFQYCAEQIGRLNDLMVAPKSHIFCHLFDLKLHCFWSFNMIVEYSLADSCRDLPSPYRYWMICLTAFQAVSIF
jgi:hypothetical protein